MKKHYILAFTMLSFLFTSQAQTPCDQGRYSTELFSNVTTTNNVNFGSNTDFVGGTTTLNMNIYEPTGDTETARPLIIWAHGGSFIGGSKTDGDVVALSNAFAKRGFVCASIDYRLGMWPIDSVNAVKAVIRAVQDMKAAVRYFYKDRATTDTYKIDTNHILVAGSSAGAITALHLAYLDKDCEVEYYIPAATFATLGGIDGTSGNAGFSSTVHGVINLAGALASYGWMEAGDVPLCSMQGDNDNTVPYNRGTANVSGFQVITMDGSRMIYERAQQVGVQNNLYTHYGADHAVYAQSAQYMDTTIKFVGDFLVDFMGCTEPIVQPANTPTGTATLYQLHYCGLGTEELEKGGLVGQIYPNPSKDKIIVQFTDILSGKVTVTDLSGRIASDYAFTGTELLLSKNEIGSGSYILKIVTDKGIITEKIIFE